jgi:hypothetical protein
VLVSEARAAFERFATERGAVMASLDPASALGLLVDFYIEVRAEDADTYDGSDAISVEWGALGGTDDLFSYTLRRSFYVDETAPEDADYGIWSLEINFVYRPNDETAALGLGSVRCEDPLVAMRWREHAYELSAHRWCTNSVVDRMEIELAPGG